MLGHGLGARPADEELQAVQVAGDVATPVALIFCELYANALEHGGGEVAVRLDEGPGGVEMEVRDQGPGLPPDFDPQRSLGLKIAHALAESDLGGNLTLGDGRPGVRAILTWRPR
jgi:two-component sensor histidine kinase